MCGDFPTPTGQDEGRAPSHFNTNRAETTALDDWNNSRRPGRSLGLVEEALKDGLERAFSSGVALRYALQVSFRVLDEIVAQLMPAQGPLDWQ
jgi:hypothetical protein